MHREIKFRGMSLRGSGFTYGHFLSWSHFNGKGYEDVFAIETPNEGKSLVDPKTVGQFTGLKDKNGKDIYEGDILEFPEFYDSSPNDYWKRIRQQVVYKYGAFYVGYIDQTFKGEDTLFSEMENYNGDFEVIGNIHENPELLCS